MAKAKFRRCWQANLHGVSTFQGHLSDAHAGLMIAWPAPLYLWALFRLVNAKTQVWKWLILSILFFYLTTTGHILLSIYVLLPVTGVFGLARLYQRDWVGIGRIFVMGTIASVLLLALFLPAIGVATNQTAYADTQGFVRYSSDSLALLTPSFFHPFFNGLDYSRAVLAPVWGEGLGYLGIFVGLLVMMAWSSRKSRAGGCYLALARGSYHWGHCSRC